MDSFDILAENASDQTPAELLKFKTLTKAARPGNGKETCRKRSEIFRKWSEMGGKWPGEIQSAPSLKKWSLRQWSIKVPWLCESCPMVVDENGLKWIVGCGY